MFSSCLKYATNTQSLFFFFFYVIKKLAPLTTKPGGWYISVSLVWAYKTTTVSKTTGYLGKEDGLDWRNQVPNSWKLLRKWCQEYADAVFDWLNALLSMNHFLSYHCSIKILSSFFSCQILFCSLLSPVQDMDRASTILFDDFFTNSNNIILIFSNKKINSSFNWID
jgi:hypothetical protein